MKFRSLEHFFLKNDGEVGWIRPPAVYSSQVEPQNTKKVGGQGGTPREVPLLSVIGGGTWVELPG